MTRNLVAGMIGLIIGGVALSGCVPPPAPPQIAGPPPAAPTPAAPTPAAPTPAAPTPIVPPTQPIALTPPVAPVVIPSARRHAALHGVHPAIHRRWVRRSYVMRSYHAPAWIPGCGGAARPCNVERTTVPIE